MSLDTLFHCPLLQLRALCVPPSGGAWSSGGDPGPILLPTQSLGNCILVPELNGPGSPTRWTLGFARLACLGPALQYLLVGGEDKGCIAMAMVYVQLRFARSCATRWLCHVLRISCVRICCTARPGCDTVRHNGMHAVCLAVVGWHLGNALIVYKHRT